MKRTSRSLTLALCLMLLTALLAGCQSGGSSGTTAAATAGTTTAGTTTAGTTTAGTTAAGTTAAATEAATTAPPVDSEHVDLSYVWTNWNNKSAEDDEVLAYINEKFNCNFDWINLAADIRAEKLGVMWAGGDKFTASFGLEGTGNAQAMEIQYRNDWLYSVDEFLDACPTITENTPDICWTYATMDDGKIYGIPESGCEVLTGLWVRQDWLRSVGLELPKTIGDLEKMMDAFRNNDPDGDGEQNTYGVSTLGSGFTGLDHYILSSYLPYGDSWQPVSDSDATLYPKFMHPNYKDYLAQVQSWSKQGYIHPNQVLFNYDTSIATFVQGEVGAFFSWRGSGDSGVGNLLEASPEADPIFISAPHNGEQGGSMAQKIYGGALVFNKQASEAEVRRFIEMIDYFCTKEGSAVNNYGVPGVQWVDNGDTVKLPEGKTKKVYSSYYRLPGGPNSVNLRPLEGGLECVNRAIMDTEQHKIDFIYAYDYMFPYKWAGTESESRISDLDKMITTAIDSIGSGTQPVEYLDGVIEQWLAAGGQTYIDEYNEQYQALAPIYGK